MTAMRQCPSPGIESTSEIWQSIDPANFDVPGHRLRRAIGCGSAGLVFEAVDLRNDRRVAVKIMRPELVSAASIERAKREAEILARLDHPGLARRFGCGEAKTPSGPRPFCAMELIDGVPLDRYLAHREDETRLRTFLMVCEAVQAAHEAGVIHRDLKPSNILVDGTGRPRIVDFGIAKRFDALGEIDERTPSGELLGTLVYVSPEQVCSRLGEVGPHTDVFSLGAILFELISGRPPHDVGALPLLEAIRIVADQPTPRLRDLRPDAPGAIDAICRHALARRPRDRYANVAELANDVALHLDGGPPRFARRATRRWIAEATVTLLAAATLVLLAMFHPPRSLDPHGTHPAPSVDDPFPVATGEPVPRAWLLEPVTPIVDREPLRSADSRWLPRELQLDESPRRIPVPPMLYALRVRAEGRLAELREIYDERIRASAPPRRRAILDLSMQLAAAELLEGNPQRAETILADAQRRFRPLDDRSSPRELVLDAMLAQVFAAEGRHDEAAALLARIVPAVDRLGLDLCAGEVHAAAAICAWRRGDLDGARAHAGSALEAYRRLLKDEAPHIERMRDLMARLDK